MLHGDKSRGRTDKIRYLRLNPVLVVSVNRYGLNLLMTGKFLNVGERELVHAGGYCRVSETMRSRRDPDLLTEFADDVVDSGSGKSMTLLRSVEVGEQGSVGISSKVDPFSQSMGSRFRQSKNLLLSSSLSPYLDPSSFKIDVGEIKGDDFSSPERQVIKESEDRDVPDCFGIRSFFFYSLGSLFLPSLDETDHLPNVPGTRTFCISVGAALDPFDFEFP